ncbi:MAG: alpha/beta fold hydrolase [Vicinamibacterales bacterium]
MSVYDRGTGAPLVVVPGIQGSWEYLRPTLDALAESFRVIGVPIDDRRVVRGRLDDSRRLDVLAGLLGETLDARGIDRAAVCGISFGGLVALRFAARWPARASALILASAPGPGYTLKRRHRIYTQAPWVFGPLFLAETPLRLRAEIAEAFPRAAERRRFAWRQTRTFLTAPLSLSGMAARARMLGASSLRAECRCITAPTLIITGEPDLDRVVPVASTLEYAEEIPGARYVCLARTGHVGYLTRPPAFASVIRAFLDPNGDSRHHAA